MSFAFPAGLARAVAARWATFVSRQEPHPSLPSAADLKLILETAFFASVEREEGRPLRFQLCCAPTLAIPRDGAEGKIAALDFLSARDFSVSELRRLAPAASAQNAAIFVKFAPDGSHPPEIAGLLHLGSDYARARAGSSFYHRGPPYALLVEVRDPGALHVYQGRFRLAYLDGGKLVRPEPVSLTDFLAIYPLVGLGEKRLMRRIAPPEEEHPREWAEFQWLALVSTIFAVVNAIARREHGGALLLVPPEYRPGRTLRIKYGTGESRSVLEDAYIQFINARHRLGDALEELEQAEQADPELLRRVEMLDNSTQLVEREWSDAIEFVGQLGSVDGAVVMTSALSVLGFGAEILRVRRPSPVMEAIGTLGPSERLVPFDVETAGMRHRSAIAFVSQHRRAVVFVVSQDGGVSFVFSRKSQICQAGSASHGGGSEVLIRRNVNVANPNMAGA